MVCGLVFGGNGISHGLQLFLLILDISNILCSKLNSISLTWLTIFLSMHSWIQPFWLYCLNTELSSFSSLSWQSRVSLESSLKELVAKCLMGTIFRWWCWPALIWICCVLKCDSLLLTPNLSFVSWRTWQKSVHSNCWWLQLWRLWHCWPHILIPPLKGLDFSHWAIISTCEWTHCQRHEVSWRFLLDHPRSQQMASFARSCPCWMFHLCHLSSPSCKDPCQSVQPLRNSGTSRMLKEWPF